MEKIHCYPRPPATKFSPQPKQPPGQQLFPVTPKQLRSKTRYYLGCNRVFFFFFLRRCHSSPPFHRSVPAPSQSVAGGAINPHGKQSREKKKEHKVRWTNNIYHLIISPCSDQSEEPYQTTCQNLSVGVRSRSSGDLIIAGHIKGLYKRHVSVFYGLIVNQNTKLDLTAKRKAIKKEFV